ncbi:MAG: M20/M25/M40 family metallo-hydrolase [Candidatus Micrarchaeaceae archaeon]
MHAEEILERLVGIDSTFPHEGRLGNFIESYLKSCGFSTQRQYLSGGRFNVLAERGNTGKAILFYGHMDTVPKYGNWKSNPLRLTADGDKLYGLGACDMKGGIAAILNSVGQYTNRKTKLLFCVDEENISEGIWKAVTEKKNWFKNVLFAVSCEPGDSKHYTGGANVVTVGRRGRAVIALDIKGLASHGANAQRGINAIDEAAKIAESLKRFKLFYNRKLGKEGIFVRELKGEATSLSVPDYAHMELDIQMVPPSTVAGTKEKVEGLVKEMYLKGRLHKMTKVNVYVKERKTPYIEPYVNDLGNKTIRRILGIVKATIGEPRLNYGSSVADDNVLFNSLKLPVVTIGPSGGNIHSQNEWVSRKSIGKLLTLYETLIKEAV